MSVKLENYNGKYKIVSLALNSEVRDDLLSDNIDFLYISEKCYTVISGRYSNT